MKIRLSPASTFLLLSVLALIVYFPTLGAPFFFDDYDLILNHPLVWDFQRLCGEWKSVGLRFVSYLTFAFNFAIGEKNPFGYHLFNLLLHLTNAWLFYFLVSKLPLIPKLKRLIPTAVAVIFLVHPLATSAVSYIWQRAELLTAFFYFLAIISYFKARNDGTKEYFVLTGICFILGLFSKGTMISLPLMILLLECSLWPVSRKKAYIIILVIGAIFFFKAYLYLWEEPWGLHSAWIMTPLMKMTGIILSTQFVWTQIEVTCQYLGLALFPVNQAFAHDTVLATSFWMPRILFSSLILILLVAFALLFRKKDKLVTIGIFWFLLTLLPSSLLGGREPMWEYRMYLPLCGVILAAVTLITHAIGSKKALIACIAIAVIFAGLTFNRNLLWQSPEALLLDNIKKTPANPNLYQHLGTLYLVDGNSSLAKKYLEKTIELAPDAAESYNNLGLIAKNDGEVEKAKSYFKLAIRYRPSMTSAYINLAYLVLGQGDDKEAETILQRSLNVEPTAGAYAALGKVYLSRKDTEKSQEFLKKALEINPAFAEAYFWYGELFASQGDRVAALAMFRQAVKYKPQLQAFVPSDYQ